MAKGEYSTTRRTKEAKKMGKFYNLNTLTEEKHVRNSELDIGGFHA
jgi:hypothetical protein